MKYCTNCGIANSDTARFCAKCGVRYQAPSSADGVTKTSPFPAVPVTALRLRPVPAASAAISASGHKRGGRFRLPMVAIGCGVGLIVIIVGGFLIKKAMSPYKAVDMVQMGVVVKARVTKCVLNSKGFAATKEGVVESLTILGRPVAVERGEFKLVEPSPEIYIHTQQHGKFKFTYRTPDRPGITHGDLSDNLLLWLTDSQKKALVGEAARSVTENGQTPTVGKLTVNGGTYEGEIKDGKPNGKGTWIHISGGEYVGEFKDGKPNGQGTMTARNGRSLVGEFKDGRPNGQVTITLSDGRQVVTEFKDGRPIRQGTRTNPDETTAGSGQNNTGSNGEIFVPQSAPSVKQAGFKGGVVLAGQQDFSISYSDLRSKYGWNGDRSVGGQEGTSVQRLQGGNLFLGRPDLTIGNLKIEGGVFVGADGIVLKRGGKLTY